MSEACEYKGYNGTIIVDGSEIRIERTGVAAKMAHGRSDPWANSIFAVSGYSLKEPGKLTNGWIEIQLGGRPAANLSATSANSDANTVIFSAQHRKAFDECAAHLKVLVENNQAHGVDPTQFVADDDPEGSLLPKAAPELRADIHEASKRMTVKFGGKREVKRLEGHLHEGETVRHLAVGRYENSNGLVALTTQRLIFVKEGLVGNTLEDFPLDKISSVQSKAGMLVAELKIYSSGNTSIIGNLAKVDQRLIAEAIRERISTKDAATPTTAAAPVVHAPVDVADQLAKFAALRDQGVISDEEFDAQKSKLLGM